MHTLKERRNYDGTLVELVWSDQWKQPCIIVTEQDRIFSLATTSGKDALDKFDHPYAHIPANVTWERK